ncbi:Glutamyl-tRNA reductase [hydrothermal vent metagenome]|uniref:Glutamyl-tRNA reductase n=1 Tax=hydrothermal vent metagenome TaxID=652676 RepID=A0A1W1C116_9ZZZZ
MKSAFKCAAKVRNATDISSKPVSMASVAVNQLKSLVDDISSKKALIIGVGEMSEITAKHLVNAGTDVYIMNRTKHKANEFEILYTATSSSEPIITDAIIEVRDFDRYWFDLALPRDINYNKGEKIQLFVIDDLKMIVDENVSSRELASRAAHGVIGRAIIEFFEVSTQDLEPLIKETLRTIKAGYIPAQYEEQAQKMCEQALKRFLHEFTTNMRSAAEDRHTELISGAMASMMKEKV